MVPSATDCISIIFDWSESRISKTSAAQVYMVSKVMHNKMGSASSP
jgi:hypothetical protein